MSDSTLTIIAAIGLSAALATGLTDHTKADDAKRLDLAECRTSLAIESEVADVCMSVVEQCRAIVEGHACSCWRAGP